MPIAKDYARREGLDVYVVAFCTRLDFRSGQNFWAHLRTFNPSVCHGIALLRFGLIHLSEGLSIIVLLAIAMHCASRPRSYGSSNLLAPTSRVKGLGQPWGWPFSFQSFVCKKIGKKEF